MNLSTIHRWYGNSSFFGGLQFPPRPLTYAERYPERRPEVLVEQKKQAKIERGQTELTNQRKLFSDTVQEIGQRLKPENMAVLEREAKKLQNGQRLIVIPLSKESHNLVAPNIDGQTFEVLAGEFGKIAFHEYRPIHEVPVGKRPITTSAAYRRDNVKSCDYDGFRREIEFKNDPIAANNFDQIPGTLFLDHDGQAVVERFKGDVAYVMLPKLGNSYILQFGIVRLA